MSNPLAPSAPSAHRQLAGLALFGLALAGCAVASYLALYQLGIVTAIWEPLFSDGSQRVLHSSLSRMLPVPDAALGAVGYLAEAVCLIVRIRTAAWTWGRFVYRALVIVFAAVSVMLVALQWGYFHAWCTLCLVSAIISLAIAGMAAREWTMRRENGRQS